MSARVFADLADLKAFLSEFKQDWHPKALRRALTGEIFRLYRYTQDKISQASQWQGRAAMTMGIAKTKGERALRALGPTLQYGVADEKTAYVGWGIRKKNYRRSLPLKWIEMVASDSPGSFVVTDETHKSIREKLARRKLHLTRRQERKFHPKTGRRIVMPSRPILSYVEKEQAGLVSRNILKLYMMQIDGKRWRKEWWKPEQDSLFAASELPIMMGDL